MTIDTKAIRELDAFFDGKATYASPAVLDLCDEVERLRHTNGKPLSTLGMDQLRDENSELRREVERLRKDVANLVHAIKADRHDWEDWPTASKDAFKAMENEQ